MSHQLLIYKSIRRDIILQGQGRKELALKKKEKGLIAFFSRANRFPPTSPYLISSLKSTFRLHRGEEK